MPIAHAVHCDGADGMHEEVVLVGRGVGRGLLPLLADHSNVRGRLELRRPAPGVELLVALHHGGGHGVHVDRLVHLELLVGDNTSIHHHETVLQGELLRGRHKRCVLEVLRHLVGERRGLALLRRHLAHDLLVHLHLAGLVNMLALALPVHDLGLVGLQGAAVEVILLAAAVSPRALGDLGVLLVGLRRGRCDCRLVLLVLVDASLQQALQRP
mmetsp:Transcript_28630/g.72415  ORF Transcript_28630/g.72415 Transcript_28630/m.72415 type:complete len:213 (-) Transcript_28630:934-1572(-)